MCCGTSWRCSASAPLRRVARTNPKAGTVAVVADDLIWASRLVEAVTRAGATPVRLSSEAQLATVLEADAAAELPEGSRDRVLVGVIVDLFGRRFDGVSAVERAAAAHKPVIAVAEHDD